ncbi:hypothetical protein CYMTET_7490 [Cymbomonas tetramitiformis]|uniref:Uncharacterized protein n=1 Tax=Cymbomonas tetramitiformis TaxID=36881 RepID=A0AAE0GV11_9CHLO|nr:hypothetical protein CYMTET_7490 [Cymbomonas tetramitiformis]
MQRLIQNDENKNFILESRAETIIGFLKRILLPDNPFSVSKELALNVLMEMEAIPNNVEKMQEHGIPATLVQVINDAKDSEAEFFETAVKLYCALNSSIQAHATDHSPSERTVKLENFAMLASYSGRESRDALDDENRILEMRNKLMKDLVGKKVETSFPDSMNEAEARATLVDRAAVVIFVLNKHTQVARVRLERHLWDKTCKEMELDTNKVFLYVIHDPDFESPPWFQKLQSKEPENFFHLDYDRHGSNHQFNLLVKRLSTLLGGTAEETSGQVRPLL